jgi:NADPH:quinone reductase-like Zn-dependent oxidoreductase
MIPGTAIETQQIVAMRRGGPQVLRQRTARLAAPGPGEVRVRMLAAGVAFADLMLREGLYPVDIPWPRVPGYDIVGEIEAVGPAVPDADVPDAFAIGARVAAITVWGSYARHRLLPAAWCVPVPAALDPHQAGALLLNHLTALQMIRRVAQLEAGDSLLVHSAAGGLGSAVLDLGRLLGIRVLGLASAAKHDYVRKLGGEPIDYRNEDVEARVRALTEGAGVHAVFDAVGGAGLRRSYRLVRPSGVVVSYGALSVACSGRFDLAGAVAAMLRTPSFSAMRLLRESKGVHGYNVQIWRDQRAASYRSDLAQILEWAAAGRLHPQVAEVLPLEQAARAHRLLGEGSMRGKLLLC